MEVLRKLRGLSRGVSGAILLSGIINGENVVIKVFPSDCPFKYLKGSRKSNSSVRDFGDYEPGTGLLFTNIFILTSITQNITTCYSISICDYAYSTEISMCTRELIPRQSTFVVTNDQTTLFNSIMNTYGTTTQQGPYEIPNRSDSIRFMMVEQCEGDMQGLLESGEYTLEVIEKMILMVLHTLLIFDSSLSGYSHNDLGTRNVLYVRDVKGTSDVYWRYHFPSGDSVISIDIPTNTPIPKIWDFAFVRFGTASHYQEYYSYFNGTVPELSRISEERENDVYVFLSDIVNLTRDHDDIIFDIDLKDIRQCRNNTEAVYKYLSQNSWDSSLLADESNDIIHSFPSDMNVFSDLNINRQVLS